jgi:hypothetical protein
MKRLMIFVLLLTASSYLQAQDKSFPIGKTKAEIRKSNEKIPLEFSTQGDTVDSYSNSSQQMVYYFQKNICYKVKEIFQLNYESAMRSLFDRFYKKINGNTWIDQSNNKIKLTKNKDKNQFLVEVVKRNTID